MERHDEILGNKAMNAKVMLPWSYGPPRAQGKYLIVEKPWRHVTVGFYCPIMAHPWEIAGRWYDLDVVECWQEVPPIPSQGI